MKTFKRFLKETEEFDRSIREAGAKLYNDFVNDVKYAIEISDTGLFTFFYDFKNPNVGDAFAVEYEVKEMKKYVGDLAHTSLIMAFVMDPEQHEAQAQISQMSDGRAFMKLFFNKFDLREMTEEDSLEPYSHELDKFEFPILELFLENEKFYRSSFIHEFTHYVDFGRGKEKVDKSIEKGVMDLLSNYEKSDEERLRDYYNDSFEYNAYYQEAIADFEHKLKNMTNIYNYKETKTTEKNLLYLLQPDDF